MMTTNESLMQVHRPNKNLSGRLKFSVQFLRFETESLLLCRCAQSVPLLSHCVHEAIYTKQHNSNSCSLNLPQSHSTQSIVEAIKRHLMRFFFHYKNFNVHSLCSVKVGRCANPPLSSQNPNQLLFYSNVKELCRNVLLYTLKSKKSENLPNRFCIMPNQKIK